MAKNIKVWLSDMETAIDEINDFLPEPRNFEVYKEDVKTKRAIERNIEIIGEAMNRIMVNHPEITIKESRKIVDTRNRIIHGYDSVSPEIIWSIVVKYLPLLKIEIEAIKNSLK